ncbi:hypothetical protein HELRODRAFT_159462 [Helobdella robusta]|uniref:C-type lectin domain-containing protein n=1 Tax=Helobdella robusta TaxID=6412 RepID=T1EP23_HELRO|nr:hypothetical protein HELRODRAFT_159462 [Helobdella robusta]ESO12873.1 hypothetical protein HELRODRAFT_159462 [Helobdella robusta]
MSFLSSVKFEDFVKISKIYFVVTQVSISVEVQRATSQIFRPAYSYLLADNVKTSVCFDDRMTLPFNVKSRNLKECIVRCLGMMNNEVRGVNYIHSNGSCSCVPKANIRYDVIPSNSVYDGQQCYVNHDCPQNFDYVIEYHKCYKMQDQILSWYDGRSLCNSISSSHPITIEDDVENASHIDYVNFIDIIYLPLDGTLFYITFSSVSIGIIGVVSIFHYCPSCREYY